MIFQPARRTFLQQNYFGGVCFAAVLERADRRWKREVELRSREEELGLVDCKAVSTLLHLFIGSAAAYLRLERLMRLCVGLMAR